jgi:hypothetical protein
MKDSRTIKTVKDLKEYLNTLPDDYEVKFLDTFIDMFPNGEEFKNYDKESLKEGENFGIFEGNVLVFGDLEEL